MYTQVILFKQIKKYVLFVLYFFCVRAQLAMHFIASRLTLLLLFDEYGKMSHPIYLEAK
jgi:hypothetical protein